MKPRRLPVSGVMACTTLQTSNTAPLRRWQPSISRVSFSFQPFLTAGCRAPSRRSLPPRQTHSLRPESERQDESLLDRFHLFLRGGGAGEVSREEGWERINLDGSPRSRLTGG